MATLKRDLEADNELVKRIAQYQGKLRKKQTQLMPKLIAFETYRGPPGLAGLAGRPGRAGNEGNRGPRGGKGLTGATGRNAIGAVGRQGQMRTCPHCTNGNSAFNAGWIRGHFIPVAAQTDFNQIGGPIPAGSFPDAPPFSPGAAPIPAGSFPDAPPGSPGAAPIDSPEGKTAAAKAAEAKADQAKATDAAKHATQRERNPRQGFQWCGKRSNCDGHAARKDWVDEHKPLKWFTPQAVKYHKAQKRQRQKNKS